MQKVFEDSYAEARKEMSLEGKHLRDVIHMQKLQIDSIPKLAATIEQYTPVVEAQGRLAKYLHEHPRWSLLRVAFSPATQVAEDVAIDLLKYLDGKEKHERSNSQ
jgi:hypothetical protein